MIGCTSYFLFSLSLLTITAKRTILTLTKVDIMLLDKERAFLCTCAIREAIRRNCTGRLRTYYKRCLPSRVLGLKVRACSLFTSIEICTEFTLHSKRLYSSYMEDIIIAKNEWMFGSFQIQQVVCEFAHWHTYVSQNIWTFDHIWISSSNNK